MKLTRWQQRFENFEAAFTLLEGTFQEKALTKFSDLEKEGIVQRFEVALELAWKTLKDYLEFSGIVFEQVTPRAVIKAAFSANLLQNAQLWIEMLLERNVLSHTYDKKKFQAAVEKIASEYLQAMKAVYVFLKTKDEE